MCNGETWHFPEPRMRYVPRMDESGRMIMTVGRPAFGDELAPILDRAFEAESDVELVASTAEFAYYALRQNYRLEADELQELVYFIPGDEANFAIWQELFKFARGDLFAIEGNEEPPKPLAVG